MGSEFIDIFFDLETTGLTTWSQIICIGAIAVKSSNGDEIPGGRFECHILPTNAIKPGATKVNGFTKEEGSLYKNGIRVDDAVLPREGLQKFMDYLDGWAGDRNVDLIAHNAFAFDGPVLFNNFRKFGIDYGISIG